VSAPRLDLDTRNLGADGPFEAWEGDHTALVHVLWAASRQGLTLEGDADAIASMVMRSQFLASARALDVHAPTPEAATDLLAQAAQYDAEAAAIRVRIAEEPRMDRDDMNLLDHNACTLERLAEALRQEASTR
jgi:hypothetical protein